jgi:hypothetical protein
MNEKESFAAWRKPPIPYVLSMGRHTSSTRHPSSPKPLADSLRRAEIAYWLRKRSEGGERS